MHDSVIYIFIQHAWLVSMCAVCTEVRGSSQFGGDSLLQNLYPILGLVKFENDDFPFDIRVGTEIEFAGEWSVALTSCACKFCTCDCLTSPNIMLLSLSAAAVKMEYAA